MKSDSVSMKSALCAQFLKKQTNMGEEQKSGFAYGNKTRGRKKKSHGKDDANELSRQVDLCASIWQI